jgi:2-polyprenyl-6-methoxyphenol hydroxylase-like FAD-dependent oxidoreductase
MIDEITIIGGGIAGLTASIALSRIGKTPVLLEAAPSLKATGAGLGLGANAVKAFGKLGIADDVIQHGRVLQAFIIYDQLGKALTKTDSAALSEKYGTSNFTIHRAELYEALLSKIDPRSIHTHKRVVDVERGEDSVTLRFQDGSAHETRFLVAADGIHSVVRNKLLPDSEPRYAGYTCWRAVIDNANLNLDEASETWGTQKRFGIVPLADDKVYWFACINAAQNDPTYRKFGVANLRSLFEDFHDPIPTILENTKDEALLWNDIIDLKPIDRYAFDRIVLIGDAAHATTPNLGQGACQAIEDAVILADEIERHSDVGRGFQRFERRRLKRTHFITNTSWRIGRMAQTEHPLLASLRNALFRILPDSLNDKQLEKLYTVDF